MFKETVKETDVIYEGMIVNLLHRHVTLPNGKDAVREVVSHPGASGILAVDQGDLLLIRQYRTPITAELLEIPAGKLDEGEEPLQCAYRELEEETGYRGKYLTFLGKIHTSPGFSDEVIHLYFTDSLDLGQIQPDEDEFIALERIPLTNLMEILGQGRITDGKTLAALALGWSCLFPKGPGGENACLKE